jgi:hypothetical protein
VKFTALVVVATILVMAVPLWSADDDSGSGTFAARLTGSSEIPANLSAGTGEISVKIDASPASASIVLKYSGLSGNVMMAHLHLGNRWETAR